jgi:hypothetical protein
MRKILAVLILLGCVEASVMMLEGCKRHAAPVAQPAVLSIPKVPQPDIPGPLPVDSGDDLPVARRAPPRRVSHSNQSQTSDAQAAAAAAAAAAQARQDAALLQQQQTASQQQQKELDHEVKQDVNAGQQMQEEPRIQDPPAPPASSGLGPDAPRIQDAPDAEEAQPGQASPPISPRIQDAPGPAQPQQPQPAQPQPAPQ